MWRDETITVRFVGRGILDTAGRLMGFEGSPVYSTLGRRLTGGPVLVGAVASLLACGDGTRIVLGDGPFGPPALVSELAATSGQDFKETLTADLLEIYFCSDRPGGLGNPDVWRSTRPNAGETWGAPTSVPEVSSPSRETGTAISADGLTFWLASDRPGGKGGYDILVSSRDSRSATWAPPTPVTELNTAGDEFPRSPGQGGLVMLPSYRSASNDQYQSFSTSRSSQSVDAGWSSPLFMIDVDTSGIDTDAYLSADGLVLYLSSDRLNAGDQDLYAARRSDTASPFGSFTRLDELSVVGAQDRDPWVSPDGRQIYFSSDRTGDLRLYRATR